MYYIKLAFKILLITLLQAVFTRYIKIASIVPDLLFVFCMYFCLQQKNITKAMIVSAICGAVMDSLLGRIFGVYVSIYLICSVILFTVKGLIFKSSTLINFGAVFLISVIGKSLFYLINIGVLKDVGFFYSLWHTILPEAVFNTVIFIFATLFINRFCIRNAGEYR